MERVAQRARPGWRAVCGWLAGYTLLSLLFCAPFVRPSTLDLTPDWGDARLITWTLAWHARWPATGEWPLDAPMFAPEPRGLANSEPMIALGLGAAPLTVLAGPVAAYHVLRLLLPVLNALAMALLAWHYLRSRSAAWTAGLVLGFSYSQIATVYLGLLHLGVLGGFVLTPLWLDRWWRDGQRGDLARAVGIALLQALVSWYAAVLVVLVVVVQIAWLAATEPGPAARMRARAAALAVAGLATAALLWPLARPFLGLPKPPREELRSYAVQPHFYVTPPHDTLAGNYMHGGAPIGLPWDWRSYFLGVATGAAALAGVIVCLVVPARRRLLWALALGVVAFGLSLGPSAEGAGWRPFDLVSALPGIGSFRAPSRMAVLVTVALALFVGVAVAALPRRWRGLAVVVLLPVFVAENLMTSLNYTPAAPLRVSPLFARLAADAPTAALVVPMLGNAPVWPTEADYLLFASRAWTPLVNGYGRRTPAIYQAIFDTVERAPHAPLGDVLRFYGVSHIVVLPRYEPARAAAFVAAADASPDLERVAESEGDVLYRVRTAAPPGR